MATPIVIKTANKSQSLAKTLAVSFLSLVLILSLSSAILGSIFSFKAQQNYVFTRQQIIAQKTANMVTSFIHEEFIAIETAAGFVNPADTTKQEQQRILNHLLDTHLAFRQLVLLSSQKQKLVVISRLAEIGFRDFIRRIESDLTGTSLVMRYTSPVYFDHPNGEPLVIIAVPTKNALGESTGVLFVEVSLKFLWESIGTLKVDGTGLVYVVDRRGNLVVCNDITRFLRGENVANIKAVAQFIHNNQSNVEPKTTLFKGINGVTVLGTYFPLVSPDWAVVIEIPALEAYQLTITTILLTLALAIIMMVAAGWISIYVARRLTVPLVKLMETTTRIAGGEMELQAEISGPAEVVSLAMAFNSMTSQLREVINSLELHSRYLQIMVQKYVEYMAEVGRGKLDTRLTIKEPREDTSDPLIILGWQLNETTANLQGMIEQLQAATSRIKHREMELEVYADKLQKSNTELEQFAYIASHDLQEPLRKIRMFGDKLPEVLGDTLDEKARDYLRRMINAAIRMENLITDLLAYSRVTTNVRPHEPVKLGETIQEVLNDLEISIHETKAEVTFENLPTIEADPLQMRQLFQNLIGNAIKYHRRDVAPVVKIDSKLIKDETGNDFYEISIVDNGIGFDNAYADRIFGLFQRLHGREEYEGTGLGLAICRKIVFEHGGSISAEGKMGEGATFKLRLPKN